MSYPCGAFRDGIGGQTGWQSSLDEKTGHQQRYVGRWSNLLHEAEGAECHVCGRASPSAVGSRRYLRMAKRSGDFQQHWHTSNVLSPNAREEATEL